MAAEAVLYDIANEQGWNESSQLSLALQYIDNQRNDDAWRDFLLEQQRDEQAHAGNPLQSEPEFVIPAECHSDDRAVEVDFDAEPWFKQASDEQILALARCGWGGDYPADEVALGLAKYSSGIKGMFSYMTIRKNMAADIGFECHVESEPAMKWLKQHKPELATLIEAEEESNAG